MKIRFKYTRGANVRFLAHLDILKVFERAIRRANIDVAYSNGFNRRPKMVFSMPLSVGLITSCDYADIELATPMKIDDFLRKMNSVLPKGIEVLEGVVFEEKANIMSLISHAKYEIIFKNEPEIIVKAIDEMKKQDTLIVESIRKRKKRIRDIKLGLLSIEVEDEKLKFMTTAGQEKNIKPEQVLLVIRRYMDEDIDVISMTRTALYITNDKGVIKDPLAGV